VKITISEDQKTLTLTGFVGWMKFVDNKQVIVQTDAEVVVKLDDLFYQLGARAGRNSNGRAEIGNGLVRGRRIGKNITHNPPHGG
jgi:hypothetical protein